MKIIFTTFILLLVYNSTYSQYKNQLLELDESKLVKLNCDLFENQYDEVLTNKIKEFKWDFDDITFYQKILAEVEEEKIDYRYLLFLSKISNSSHSINNSNRIFYYYKLKFAILAVENGTNLPVLISDSIKIQIIKKYYTASTASNAFQDDSEFKNYAEYVLKYINKLKFSNQIDKYTTSMFYQTKGDIIYEIYIITEGDNYKISEALLNYQMAINEDKNNWKAYASRGKLKYYRLQDYSGALEDYKTGLTIENKKKFPLAPNLTTFHFEIGECLLKQEKFKEAISYYKNINTLYLEKITRKNNQINKIDKEYYSQYIGIFYFKLANCYYYLKNKIEACNYFKKSLNFGYSPENLVQSKSIFNCK